VGASVLDAISSREAKKGIVNFNLAAALMRKMAGQRLAVEIGSGSGHLRKVSKEHNGVANGKRDPSGKEFAGHHSFLHFD
jgi:hypothetical protein